MHHSVGYNALNNFLQDNVNNYMLQGARGLSVHKSASVHAGQEYIAAEFRTPFR